MGMPREKLAVPSMGSTIHTHSESFREASSPSSPMNADPGSRSRSSFFRNLSFSTSADVTRFSREPLVFTVKSWSFLILRPDSLTIPSSFSKSSVSDMSRVRMLHRIIDSVQRMSSVFNRSDGLRWSTSRVDE